MCEGVWPSAVIMSLCGYVVILIRLLRSCYTSSTRVKPSQRCGRCVVVDFRLQWLHLIRQVHVVSVSCEMRNNVAQLGLSIASS
jgi:hypothetical protein